MSRGGSGNKATGYDTMTEVPFPLGTGRSFFSAASKMALGHSQASIPVGTWDSFCWVKAIRA
jgi:hypothetical protein